MYYTSATKHKPSPEADISPTHSRKSHVFVESEGSLACLHGPASGPYPEPPETSPQLQPSLSDKLCYQHGYIIRSHLCLGLRSGLFSSDFRNTLCAFLISPMCATYPCHRILICFITGQYSLHSINH
jgi:hypothetical protein